MMAVASPRPVRPAASALVHLYLALLLVSAATNASAERPCSDVLTKDELKHTVAAVAAAKLKSAPYPHVFVPKIFSDDVYRCILRKLPANEKPYARKNDGTSKAVTNRLRRYIITLNTYAPKGKAGSPGAAKKSAADQTNSYDNKWWDKFAKLFTESDELRNAWLGKFGSTLKHRHPNFRRKYQFYTRLDLTRDYGGYAIGPHSDNSDKWITMLYYLPKTDSKLKVGTCVLENLLRRRVSSQSDVASWNKRHWKTHFQAPFVRNAVFAFAPCDASWHAVPKTPEGFRRDTLQSFIQAKVGNAPKGRCGR